MCFAYPRTFFYLQEAHFCCAGCILRSNKFPLASVRMLCFFVSKEYCKAISFDTKKQHPSTGCCPLCIFPIPFFFQFLNIRPQFIPLFLCRAPNLKIILHHLCRGKTPKLHKVCHIVMHIFFPGYQRMVTVDLTIPVHPQEIFLYQMAQISTHCLRFPVLIVCLITIFYNFT